MRTFLSLCLALTLTPTLASAQTAIELLTSKAEFSRTGNFSAAGYPFNVYYEDTRFQSIYTAAELAADGVLPGDVITEVALKVAETPLDPLDYVAFNAGWTSAVDLTSGFETPGYGLTAGPFSSVPTSLIVPGAWFAFDVDDLPAWDGTSNLIIDYIHDSGGWGDFGGIYLRDNGSSVASRRMYTDSNCGPAPFSPSCGGGGTLAGVASLQLTVIEAGPVDADGDGYAEDVDCDDSDPMVNPGMSELCDGLDTDCDGNVPADESDADMDGQSVCAGDCDDADAANFTGNAEICDGMDNDCNGDADFGAVMMGDDDDSAAGDDDDSAAGDDDDSAAGDDDDSAGVVDSLEDDEDGDGYLECGMDCDDWDAAINPDADELCDGIDNDCNGLNDFMYPMGDDDDDSAAGDDDDSAMGDDDDSAMGDDDDSAMGDDDDSAMGDDSIEVDMDMDGFLLCAGDCDDMSDTVYPGAPELCGDMDEDCDGLVGDDEIDGDGDGFTPCDGDCEDAFAEDYPGAPELCDGYDNDCDGALPADEEDADEDGEATCEGDCDDAEPTANSMAAEVCDDGIDNDCDGATDGDDSDCENTGDDDDAAGDDDDAAGDDDDDDDDDNGGSACDCSTLGQRDAAPVGMLVLLGLGLGVMRRRS